ncbi:hypothetical protein H1C71_018471 [Ictidomys tridecemlineatus]|nr:hypothetical protein H1C71_018471 [Ictidomys tridecemlineatus]KAG3263447.1 hypothetical protein H1C71_018471 [Ictidomys tridecemlineatus]
MLLRYSVKKEGEWEGVTRAVPQASVGGRAVPQSSVGGRSVPQSSVGARSVLQSSVGGRLDCFLWLVSPRRPPTFSLPLWWGLGLSALSIISPCSPTRSPQPLASF